jgi:hypothetical protein
MADDPKPTEADRHSAHWLAVGVKNCAETAVFSDRLLEVAEEKIAQALATTRATAEGEALESVREFMRGIDRSCFKNDDKVIGYIEDELDARIERSRK